MLLAGMAFTAGIGSGRVNAQDDVTLTASVVSGSCDSPGDTAGELRDLTVSEGGAFTSFSRIDVAIDDLTSGGYAIVVASDGEPVACGDISGTGDDVYIAVTSQSDAGYGGIAWLHAREAQTQVSLFISQGLGGGTGDNGNVEPPAEETPEPPVEDTPEPRATRTPDAEPTEEVPVEGTTYESPTFGYTVTYDDSWQVVDETTTPTDNGPQDFLHLFNNTSHAYFYTNAASEDFPIEQFPNIMLDRAENNPNFSNVQVRLDEDGNEIQGSDDSSAWVAYTATFTNQDGQSFEIYDYFRGYKLPGQPAVLIFLNEGLDLAYDIETPGREALMDSLEIPG
jgi:hypothetical protein